MRILKEDLPFRVALFCLVLYLLFLHFVVMSGQPWEFDWLGGFRLLSHDDPYRYYYSWAGWTNLEAYGWNYILPVPLFLDGAIASIFKGQLYPMRFVHVLICCVTLWAMGHSLQILGVHKRIMVFCILLLGLMPLYVLVGISFLGESWLIAAVALTGYFYLRGQLLPMTLMASLLPLIRPEGVFILAPVSVWLLIRGQYFLFLLSGLAGFLYLIFLLFTLDSLSQASEWRNAFVDYFRYFPKRKSLESSFGYLDTLNVVFLLGVLLSFRVKQWCQHWPLWLGSTMWLAFLTIIIVKSDSNYEPRYLMASMPALVMSCGVSCHWLYKKLSRQEKYYKNQSLALILMLIALIALEHSLQFDWLRMRTGLTRIPFPGVTELHPDAGRTMSPGYLDERKRAGKKIVEYIRNNSGIDTVLIAADDIFYNLSPSDVPSHVRVKAAPFDSTLVLAKLDGAFYAMSPHKPFYGYYEFFHGAQGVDGELLYVGNLFCRVCIPNYKNKYFRFYKYQYFTREML